MNNNEMNTPQKTYWDTLYTCPICGKQFLPAVEHAWKIGTMKKYEKLVCSYTCMRTWEKDLYGDKKKRG